MMKTALSIVQSTLKRINEPFPTSLYGSTDPGDLQLLEFLYATCQELRQARCWTQQKRSHNFDTVADTTQYKLPADFYSPLLSTHWNEDQTERLDGPISDSIFNWYLYGVGDSSHLYNYRIFGWDENTATGGGQFEVYPTPSSAQTLRFDYTTRNLFLPAHYALATAYSADDLVNISGNVYKCGAGGITASDTVPTGKTTGIVDDDGTWDWYNTPHEVLGADSDLCLFDYDLVALGVKAKWYQENGGDWQPAHQEYWSKINQAVNRYKGSHIGSFSRRYRGPNLRIPYKSWDI